jgi:uncharacterized damage-inducible protein DinB
MSDVRIDTEGRPEPPMEADEVGTLLGYLDFQRATLAWKTSGLDAAGLGTTVGASTLTLGGLLKHLALVEMGWFARALHDLPRGEPWDGVDWDADPDWDFHSAADDTPDELRSLWEASVARARTLVDDALSRGGLDQVATQRWSDGRAISLRWIIAHMIEEYARHNGHADLIREVVDGSTGE